MRHRIQAVDTTSAAGRTKRYTIGPRFTAPPSRRRLGLNRREKSTVVSDSEGTAATLKFSTPCRSSLSRTLDNSTKNQNPCVLSALGYLCFNFLQVLLIALIVNQAATESPTDGYKEPGSANTKGQAPSLEPKPI